MKIKLKFFSILITAVVLLVSCASVEEEKAPVAEEPPAAVEQPAAPAEEPAPEPAPKPEAEEPEQAVTTAGERPEGVSEEIEPNDSPEDANYADFGKPITITINPKKDHDWFRVLVEKQGYIQVQTKNAPKALGIEVQFSIYDEFDDTQVIRNWHRTSDACAVMPGEYFIRLHDNYDDAFSPEPFQILIDFIEEMDASESNNTEKTATEIKPGQALRPAIFPRGDQDWFKIKVDEQGYLQAQARDVPKGLALEVSYYTWDEWDGKTTIRSWNRLPDGCAVQPGEYYIRLHDNYDDAASSENFPFKIDFLKEIDASEPNNSPEDAVEAKPGDTVYPAIYPRGDNDWFKVKVEEQGYLRITARDVPKGLGLEVSYHTWDEWDGTSTVRKWRRLPDGCAVQPGEYYIRLHDNYDDAAAAEAFPMRIEFLEEVDPAEPNDNPADAKPFQPGDTKEMAIYPIGEQDYYSVKPDRQGTITLQAQNVPRGIGLEAALFAEDDDNPGKYNRVKGYQRLPAAFEVEADQQYYVRFIDNYNDAGSPDTFQVRMELE